MDTEEHYPHLESLMRSVQILLWVLPSLGNSKGHRKRFQIRTTSWFPNKEVTLRVDLSGGQWRQVCSGGFRTKCFRSKCAVVILIFEEEKTIEGGCND